MKVYPPSRITFYVSCLLVIGRLGMDPAGAQDVFLGGGLDFEIATGSHTVFDWGRWSGVNFTYDLDPRAEVYFEYNLAGGKGRTSAFYASFPALREQHIDLSLGRVGLPFGLPGVDPVRRYVPGAPDWLNRFPEFRSGNVFLDHFGDGLRAAYEGSRWRVDTAVVNAPDVNAKDVAARVTIQGIPWEGGVSAFSGEVEDGQHLAWLGPHLSGVISPSTQASVEALWGRHAGRDQRAYYAQVHHRWKTGSQPTARSYTVFASWAQFDPEAGGGASILQLGWQQQLDSWGQVELRYEFRESPGPADDQLVLRYKAIY